MGATVNRRKIREILPSGEENEEERVGELRGTEGEADQSESRSRNSSPCWLGRPGTRHLAMWTYVASWAAVPASKTNEVTSLPLLAVAYLFRTRHFATHDLPRHALITFITRGYPLRTCR